MTPPVGLSVLEATERVPWTNGFLVFFSLTFLPSHNQKARREISGKSSRGLLAKILEKSGTLSTHHKNKFAIQPHATPLEALYDTP